MYITRVRMENIRGFSGERNVDLDLRRPDGTYAGWTVIAGRNGSGKTSLLRGIALVLGGPSVSLSVMPDLENWITTGQQSGRVEAELDYDSVLDRPAEGASFTGGSIECRIGWAYANGGPRQGQRPSTFASGQGYQSSEGFHQGPWHDNPTGWFCAAYGPFRRLIGGSGTAQRLMAGSGPASRLVSLFHEDASLAEGVSWLIDQHLRALERRPGAEELKMAAIEILRDGLLPDGYGVEGVDSDGLWIERSGHRFPLREMSDGYRSVAALVVDLLKQIHEAYGELAIDYDAAGPRVTVPGVVIIDEVDAHLHVSWQQRIGYWLKRHFPAIQFIVTTHSPYICQSADPGGLIRLPGPDEQTPPLVVSEDLWERVVYGSGDDAALSDLFGLDTPYSKDARALRRELIDLEHDVVSGRANAAQRERYTHLTRLLTSSAVARADEVATRLTDR